MTTEFILAHGEKFEQCPYNTSHQITDQRMTFHLEKCRKAYLKTLAEEGRKPNMAICRFNATHHVPDLELKVHESKCQDSMSVVRYLSYHNSAEGTKKYDERRKQDSSRRSPSPSTSRSHSHSHSKRDKEKPETKPFQTNDWGLEEEDWEADCSGDGPGYDPEIKLKTEMIMYNPAGLTKSERKKFRNEVRQKAAEQSLKGEPVEFPTANTFDVKPDIKNLKIEIGRSSPLEPGEIDDDEVDKAKSTSNHRDGSNNSHSRSRDGEHHRDIKYKRSDSHSGSRDGDHHRDIKYERSDSHSGSRDGDHHRDIKYERSDSHSDKRDRDYKYDRRDTNSDRRDTRSDRRDTHSDRRDSHSDRRDSHSDRRDSHYDRRNSNFERRDSRSDGRTSTSSRPYASRSKSSNSMSGNSCTNRKRFHEDDGPYSDNDDFAGFDPYA